MDRDKAIRLLKGGPKGVAEWNRRREAEWNRRREADEEIPDLSEADLTGARLDRAILAGARLNRARLDRARLDWAILTDASLDGASLVGASLEGASLDGASLVEARLDWAILDRAILADAILDRASLDGAFLVGAFLVGASLDRASLNGAVCLSTAFAKVDLSKVKGLDQIEHLGPSQMKHLGPSTIGIDTLFRSRGKIPEAFLRGCGVPDALIAYLPSLIGSMSPIQFYSVFISYSSKDRDFADRLYADLQAQGIRCWLDHEHLTIGDEIRDVIEVNIRVHDKMLLVLSEHSVASEWVCNEVETALEKERRQKHPVLFPIRLDEAVMETEAGWAGLVRRRRHIGDFRRWKDHDAYQKGFARLLRDLKAVDSTAK